MIQGELYWIEFPPSQGHEQAGRRPAIVLETNPHLQGRPTVIVVPVTGQPRNSRFTGTVTVQPSDLNGLLKESVILVFQIRAIDQRRLQNRIGLLEPDRLQAIFRSLEALLGIESRITNHE
ncbi:MAG: type II toxin-antitoxin system PemK/MazF family toxin [Gemmataceae bacterium]